jgi:GNAT superfamily N-acetyltransferase
MWWRVERGANLWKQQRGARAKRSFKSLVKSGRARGILAFSGDRPVGWCAFGPRVDFPRLSRSRSFNRSDVEGVWSINCFFIARDFRGRGIARKLLDAAIRACRRRRAHILEAYPITETVDGRRVSSTFAYTGPICIFEEHGFKVVQRLSPTRPLVRLTLRGEPLRT